MTVAPTVVMPMAGPRSRKVCVVCGGWRPTCAPHGVVTGAGEHKFVRPGMAPRSKQPKVITVLRSAVGHAGTGC